jgi:hypothetical protein
MARARLLRWVDFVAAWLLVFVILGTRLGATRMGPVAILAAAVVALATLVPPLRVRWRPASGLAGLLVSRALRPGDRAWYVRGERADLVIVTACRWLRVSIAAPELGAAESLSVRRTRVLVVPAVTAG